MDRGLWRSVANSLQKGGRKLKIGTEGGGGFKKWDWMGWKAASRDFFYMGMSSIFLSRR